jgi:hypothetical protein
MVVAEALTSTPPALRTPFSALLLIELYAGGLLPQAASVLL